MILPMVLSSFRPFPSSFVPPSSVSLQILCILTLRLKPGMRHRVIPLASWVDRGFELEHVYHAVRLLQMNASSVMLAYRRDALSMSLPYWRALAEVYWFLLNVHLAKMIIIVITMNRYTSDAKTIGTIKMDGPTITNLEYKIRL